LKKENKPSERKNRNTPGKKDERLATKRKKTPGQLRGGKAARLLEERSKKNGKTTRGRPEADPSQNTCCVIRQRGRQLDQRQTGGNKKEAVERLLGTGGRGAGRKNVDMIPGNMGRPPLSQPQTPGKENLGESIANLFGRNTANNTYAEQRRALLPRRGKKRGFYRRPNNGERFE